MNMLPAPRQDWASFHEAAVFGKANGKILWQPRIGAWWSDRIFSQTPFPGGYSNDLYELYRQLGVSARLYEFGSCIRRLEDPRVRFINNPVNVSDTETVIETPVGKQTYVRRKTPNSAHHITLKWEVADEDELKVAIWREEHTSWEWDQDKFNELQIQCGDLGAPTLYLPRMNIQCLYIEKMGVENGIFALYDFPETVEKFFAAREEASNRLLALVNTSPVNIINFGENIHAGTLPPDLFLKYHLPECQRRCDILHQGNKFCHSHWDGDTKPLLQYAKETGLDGIEAITPKPQGDVTLEEIKAALGDQMYLLDGIPAIYFEPRYDEQLLIDCAHRLIDLFGTKLILGISDEISAVGDIERIRTVARVVDEFNSRT